MTLLQKTSYTASIVLGVLFIISCLYFSDRFDTYKVPTDSMEPAIKQNDVIMVHRTAYADRAPQRGDIAGIKLDSAPDKFWVKRVVGLPGEKLSFRDGFVYIDGERLVTEWYLADKRVYLLDEYPYGHEGVEVLIPEGHYFILGDYSSHSIDSRVWGPIKGPLKGKAVFILSPLGRFGLIEKSFKREEIKF